MPIIILLISYGISVKGQSTEFETNFRTACTLIVPEILNDSCTFIKSRNDQLTNEIIDKYSNIINDSCSKLNRQIIEYNQLCNSAEKIIINKINNDIKNKNESNKTKMILIIVLPIVLGIGCMICVWISCCCDCGDDVPETPLCSRITKKIGDKFSSKPQYPEYSSWQYTNTPIENYNQNYIPTYYNHDYDWR